MSENKSNSIRLLSLLKENNLIFTVAESCTGGLISKKITDLDGSSSVFWGGFVTYSNEAKIKLLSVERSLLENYGAVSEETVIDMAMGALKWEKLISQFSNLESILRGNTYIGIIIP